MDQIQKIRSLKRREIHIQNYKNKIKINQSFLVKITTNYKE